MQQYLALCARAGHKGDLNTTLLDFGPTRQQLEDGDFGYPLNDYLSNRVKRPVATASPAAAAPAGSTNRTAARTSSAADAIINSQ